MDYLLWGIPWVVVQTMVADAARINTQSETEKNKEDEPLKLNSKEQIRDFLKGQM